MCASAVSAVRRSRRVEERCCAMRAQAWITSTTDWSLSSAPMSERRQLSAHSSSLSSTSSSSPGDVLSNLQSTTALAIALAADGAWREPGCTIPKSRNLLTDSRAANVTGPLVSREEMTSRKGARMALESRMDKSSQACSTEWRALKERTRPDSSWTGTSCRKREAGAQRRLRRSRVSTWWISPLTEFSAEGLAGRTVRWRAERTPPDPPAPLRGVAPVDNRRNRASS
mmetsp:Transcript_24892/g.80177  ORF Transcript_24892/g.80177 Transcript_24892/m.80177 type:complete len:228 (-) Transcript_24892:252-935(-)